MALSTINNDLPQYGVDIDITTDIPLIDNLAVGVRTVANAVYRRLNTDSGALGIINDDVNYGLNIIGMLESDFNPIFVSQWQSQITNEILKIERINNVNTTINYSQQTSTLTIELDIELSDATQFNLILNVSQLGVQMILNP